MAVTIPFRFTATIKQTNAVAPFIGECKNLTEAPVLFERFAHQQRQPF
jgi:hypothetical protein